MVTVKSQVLAILEKNKGRFLSGEELAEKLGCSRAAIWKAVKSLREEGYSISSGTNRGYALEPDNDILSEEAVRQGLINKEISLYIYKEIDSTNQCLKQMLVNGKVPLSNGAAVIAEFQTQGKGRRGRSFSSPRGTGLYMSILVRPKAIVGQSLVIRAAAAVAVYRAVKKLLDVELDIRWVNDLYYEERKICGILTEAITDFETGEVECAIVGIGIRLVDSEDGSKGIYRERTKKIDRNALAAEVINSFLEEVKREEISPIYRSRNIPSGKQAVLSRNNGKERIQVKGILPDGRLLIVNEEGQEEAVTYGEIEILREERV